MHRSLLSGRYFPYSKAQWLRWLLSFLWRLSNRLDLCSKGLLVLCGLSGLWLQCLSLCPWVLFDLSLLLTLWGRKGLRRLSDLCSRGLWGRVHRVHLCHLEDLWVLGVRAAAYGIRWRLRG